jgi:hypothetical protein
MGGGGMSEKEILFFISKTPFFLTKVKVGEGGKFDHLHRSNALLITKVKGEGFFLYKKKRGVKNIYGGIQRTYTGRRDINLPSPLHHPHNPLLYKDLSGEGSFLSTFTLPSPISLTN